MLSLAPHVSSGNSCAVSLLMHGNWAASMDIQLYMHDSFV
jgi:hypothetical protein